MTPAPVGAVGSGPCEPLAAEADPVRPGGQASADAPGSDPAASAPARRPAYPAGAGGEGSPRAKRCQ